MTSIKRTSTDGSATPSPAGRPKTQSGYAYSPNIIAVGDFNMPAMTWNDPTYRELGSRGNTWWCTRQWVGSNIKNDKHQSPLGHPTPDGFLACTKYFISNHRILWDEPPSIFTSDPRNEPGCR